MDCARSALSRDDRRFTLVECAGVVSVIGLLAAILLPAVNAAREAARRSRCVNNLRQLATAAHAYHATHGRLPMGTPAQAFPDSTIPVGQSLFVSMLPQLEQSAIYHGVNFNRNIYTYANQTVHQVGLAVLHCPSDGTIDQEGVYPRRYENIPSGNFKTAYSSYVFEFGTLYHINIQLGKIASLSRGDDGIAFANSVVGFQDVTDGMSHTLLFGERPHGRLDDWLRLRWHWSESSPLRSDFDSCPADHP